jgi:hypothetical protein
MPIFTQRGDIVASEKNVHTYTSEARLLSKARKLSKALLVSSTSTNFDKIYNCIQIKQP